MSLEVELPIEFTVRGTAVSLQAMRKESIAAWKARVRAASEGALPEGHFATSRPISVTLFYFPDVIMPGDLDNIVKPILDAMARHIYIDDRQVERIWVQKLEPGKLYRFSQPSSVLAEALEGEKPLLYVRLSGDPMEGLA